MSNKQDRRAELERKRAKLQSLREQKDRVRREKEQKDGKEILEYSSFVPAEDSCVDIDQMLSSLGVTPVKDLLSSLSSKSLLSPPNTALPEVSPSHTDELCSHTNRKKKIEQLQKTEVQSTDIPPKENMTYTKQTQTTNTGMSELRDARATDYYDEYNLNPGLEWEYDFTDDEEDGAFNGKLLPGILPHGLPTVEEVQPAIIDVPREKEKEKKVKVRELSAEEKLRIQLSSEFQRFVRAAARTVERALAETSDIDVDYTSGGDTESGAEHAERRVALLQTWGDERWSRGRAVSSLDWSRAHPELLLAAYHGGSQDAGPPPHEGVCVVWNTKFRKDTPEDVFHCQSPVTSAIFTRFHPNLILGGTYSGQIVLWDNRVYKRTPVQRTPLSAIAHTHPVYCVDVVGSQNSHNIISVSTDGRMCSWALDMLSQPPETLNLLYPQKSWVAVMALNFPLNDINNFVVGGEDGCVYRGCRHGQRAGLVDCVEGHAGPVTAVACHRAPGAVDFGHLYLTASVDWSVKLWSLKEQRPIYSFEDSGDYVTDVRWSPAHPALFAAVDAAGTLDIWNLNSDTEVPVESVQADSGAAFNHVSWNPSGNFITVGDDAGQIQLYELAENLWQPRENEWTKLSYTLQELRNNQLDAEADSLSGLGLMPSDRSSIGILNSSSSNYLG